MDDKDSCWQGSEQGQNGQDEFGGDGAENSGQNEEIENSEDGFKGYLEHAEKIKKHPLNKIIPLSNEEKEALSNFGNSEQDSNYSEIPKFDLGKDILSAQRSRSAMSRVGPGKDFETKDYESKASKAFDRVRGVGANKPVFNKVISEIVFRDINRYYMGERYEWGHKGRNNQIEMWGLFRA